MTMFVDGKNVDIDFGLGRKTFLALNDHLQLLKDIIMDTVSGIPFPNPLPYTNEVDLILYLQIISM